MFALALFLACIVASAVGVSLWRRFECFFIYREGRLR